MGARQWLNENSTLASAVAAGVAVVALLALIWQATGGGSGMPTQAYYYDVRADAFFVDAIDLYPPITTPDGHTTGVRAHLRGCDGCPADIAGMSMDELAEHRAFVVYLERYSDEAKEALEAHRENPDPDNLEVLTLEETGRLVSDADAERWLPLNSERGMQVTDRGFDRVCDDGATPRRCMP